MLVLPSENTFYIIDLDRCLANTDMIFGIFEHIVQEETTLDQGALRAAREQMEKTGGSFDVTVYLQESNQQDALERIKARFMEVSQKYDLFEPGARDLLQFLVHNSLPFGILTYGGKVWQTMKLRAMHLDSNPYMITGIKAKGQLIASWKQDDTFLIPQALGGGSFKNVLLVDDKLVSFEGLPEGAFGIHVLTSHPLQSRGPAPVHVVQAHGMTEVEVLIKSSISA